ncbi:putative adenosine monophosphate-protein transferase Fic [Rugamonas sp. CCM 8940]|uniref:putative adenosine monophosphate-protein transferase Fic n=1 Tax=Rugamonas sp. CCM 8940 TaxID=2765359 RepID=UPI0018F35BAF|nr:putative adenosine monophosphate-protein transferase Fic [Rugamonas sp. CCM 8940]MBJ7312068.1 putative adenosine monophosphate-protein transferase Fic [Rugamonas sp. CCM 8940]
MSAKYGTGQDGQYCYPNSDVLINKLGITDRDALDAAEIELSQARIEQYEPNFDDISLPALREIHFHLFQDLYDWAGELRAVDISKGNTRFANASRIVPEANKLFQQLGQENYLIGLPRAQFLARLAHYFGELNVIHPFRDGNGRAQRLMFEVISINAGFALRWAPIEQAEWVEANIAAYNCRLEPLTELLNRALTPF